MTTPGHDPDDWFDEPDTSDAWASRVDRIARSRDAQPPRDLDDWIGEREPREPRERRRLPARRPAIVAGVLGVVLLLGILAAAGVFSGSGKHASAPPATTAHTTPATTTTATKPAPDVPTTPLKPGDTGTAVRQLQRALARAGYGTGAADGSYGPATKQAVTRFQQAHGLTADGIAGTKTLAALRRALQAGSG